MKKLSRKGYKGNLKGVNFKIPITQLRTWDLAHLFCSDIQELFILMLALLSDYTILNKGGKVDEQ